MKISDNLLCLFSAEVDADGDTYTIEIPKREVEIGDISTGETYRIGMLPRQKQPKQDVSGDVPHPTANRQNDQPAQTPPPVGEGDVFDVEIESIGDQGDGIAKVGPGYVLVVPDTEVGEKVTIRVDEATNNVGFADVVDRHPAQTHD